MQKQIIFFIPILLLTAVIFTQPVFASNKGCISKIKLQDYGPNTIAIRSDENDEANIDFVLSQKVPLFHDGCADPYSTNKWFLRPYFTFTGQFGFYAIGERDSKPVIGKRFNPKLLFRHWIGEIHGDGESDYFDIGYAHESNGQSINSQQAYLLKQAEFINKGERVEFAEDYLSRGWDYIDFTLEMANKDNSYFTSKVYLEFKYFLANGLLQGSPEETYPWETANKKSRAEVDGISILLKSSTIPYFKEYGVKAALLYTTGYKDIFKNNTLRFEVTVKPKEWLPIQVWVSEGYNSSLTDYYKKIRSFGIGFELRNFTPDI